MSASLDRRGPAWGVHAVVALALSVGASSGLAQQPEAAYAAASPPAVEARRTATLVPGERMSYDVKFGALTVGKGRIEVLGVEEVRGRPAWHTVFTMRGGVPLYRVDDRMESWIDAETFASLRSVKRTREGRFRRDRRVEFFPDERTFVEGDTGGTPKPSVAQPLDEGSFLFFLRTVALTVGERYEFDRYYKPDRNPVTIRVLRRERVETPAGTFETVVLQPVIKTRGIFSEKGRAEVWITDDERRLVVKVKADLSFGSLSMHLREYVPGAAVALTER